MELVASLCHLSSSNSSTSYSSRCTPTKREIDMLVHLRRSFIMAVICMVFFGFVYAYAGTGVSQVLFKNQADGSLTADGSTLIGQPWNFTKCPGHPLGRCVFPGR